MIYGKRKGMVKAVTLMVTALVLCVSLFGCADYGAVTTDEVDAFHGSEKCSLSLRMSVEKTKFKVGETVDVTVTFKNLSGRDLKVVEFLDPGLETVTPEDLIFVRSLRKGAPPEAYFCDDCPEVEKYEMVIEKDYEVTCVKKITIENRKHNALKASVRFGLYEEGIFGSYSINYMLKPVKIKVTR